MMRVWRFAFGVWRLAFGVGVERHGGKANGRYGEVPTAFEDEDEDDGGVRGLA